MTLSMPPAQPSTAPDPQAHDIYRVILKDDALDVDVGSIDDAVWAVESASGHPVDPVISVVHARLITISTLKFHK